MKAVTIVNTGLMSGVEYYEFIIITRIIINDNMVKRKWMIVIRMVLFVQLYIQQKRYKMIQKYLPLNQWSIDGYDENEYHKSGVLQYYCKII